MKNIQFAQFTGGAREQDRRSNSKPNRIRINNDIRAKEVRVVDEEGNMLGIMKINKALFLAEEKKLDLIEIAPTAKPPVCKIMDFGKYQYELQKKEKYQRKQQQQQQMKEIRFKWRTATHDFNFKVKHARRFIDEGNKVKATVMFRGREITHKEVGRELLDKFIEALEDIAKIDQRISSEGRYMSVIMVPNKTKNKKSKDKETK